MSKATASMERDGTTLSIHEGFETLKFSAN
ncbi:predicted protein [Sclerotinia sclerotiorum 1980 UF-70]|uniref:Uncharacterized protein n=1 Tax=Sclerotinia sclerotiorum (strain ATCC 18683 / 1980 / Ss-1) TaxID=665079 RepID=A7EBR8_SCLS1|nr:predicted protein [Sclerotinia sclerotiorum 1980 UF-70]EDN99896.1 predicted protein [Sclerotinia sclerotiorum 1980 UF-70]